MALAVAVIAVVLGARSTSRSSALGAGSPAPACGPCARSPSRAALRLPLVRTLAGAALSGLPSLLAVLVDVHWAGTPLSLLLFGLWCGWVAARGERGSGRDRAPRAVTA